MSTASMQSKHDMRKSLVVAEHDCISPCFRENLKSRLTLRLLSDENWRCTRTLHNSNFGVTFKMRKWSDEGDWNWMHSLYDFSFPPNNTSQNGIKMNIINLSKWRKHCGLLPFLNVWKPGQTPSQKWTFDLTANWTNLNLKHWGQVFNMTCHCCQVDMIDTWLFWLKVKHQLFPLPRVGVLFHVNWLFF